MPLVTRGRLSVQRVEKACWDIIEMLAEKGGWDQELSRRPKGTGRGKKKASEGLASENEENKKEAHVGETEGEAVDAEKRGEVGATASSSRKRKAKQVEKNGDTQAPRRSTRTKKSVD